MNARLTAAAALMTLSGAAVAGPVNLDSIPRDAQLVVHVDVEAIAGSDLFGGLLAGLADADFDVDGLSELREMGINPVEDILSITVVGFDIEDEEAVVMMETTDALDRVVDQLGQMVRFREGPNGWNVGAMDGEGAFAYTSGRRGTRRVILGEDASLVRGALRGGGFDGPEPRRGALVYGTVGNLSAIVGDELPPFIGEIRSAFFTLGEEDDGLGARLSIETGDRKAANALSQTANGFLGLARMSMPPEIEQFGDLIDGLNISSDGAFLTASLFLSADDLQDALAANFGEFDLEEWVAEEEAEWEDEADARAEEIEDAIEELEDTIEELEDEIEELEDEGAPRSAIRAIERVIRQLEKQIEELKKIKELPEDQWSAALSALTVDVPSRK
ncbi:MAG: hypothetical protein AAGI17_05950 [Planctomycetota bacterium]